MARQRSPKRDTAYTIWQNVNGNITLKEIANQLDISDTQVRQWKRADKWELNNNANNNTNNNAKNNPINNANNNATITPALNNRKVFLCLSEAITALLSAKSFSAV